MADKPDTPWWRDITKVLMFITAVTGMITAIQTQCNQMQIADGNRRIEHIATEQEAQMTAAVVARGEIKESSEKLDKIQEKAANIEYKTQVIDAKLPNKKN